MSGQDAQGPDALGKWKAKAHHAWGQVVDHAVHCPRGCRVSIYPVDEKREFHAQCDVGDALGVAARQAIEMYQTLYEEEQRMNSERRVHLTVRQLAAVYGIDPLEPGLNLVMADLDALVEVYRQDTADGINYGTRRVGEGPDLPSAKWGPLWEWQWEECVRVAEKDYTEEPRKGEGART